MERWRGESRDGEERVEMERREERVEMEKRE